MRHFLHNSERAMMATRSATVRALTRQSVATSSESATSSKRVVEVETEHTSKRQRVAPRGGVNNHDPSPGMAETYTVGPAVLGDTGQLKTLMNGPAFSQVYTNNAHEVPFIKSAFLQKAIKREDYIVLVSRLLKTKDIVGYVQAHISDQHWYVAELFVLEEHRKQGLGAQLVNGVLQAAGKRQGTQRVSEVKLEAETDGLVLFYKTLGFEKEEGSSTIMRYALSR